MLEYSRDNRFPFHSKANSVQIQFDDMEEL